MLAAYSDWEDRPNNTKKGSRFGDDSRLPSSILEDLDSFMDDYCVKFRWNAGCFVIVDNTVVYHSRESFKGKRQVYASLGKGLKPVEDKNTHLVVKSGDKLPQIGVGLSSVIKDSCEELILNAIQVGYRLFLSDSNYGNETQTGLGLSRAIEIGLVNREDLFIISKLGNKSISPQEVKTSVV